MVKSNASVLLRFCTFANNSAKQNGGAISCEQSGDTFIERCMFYSNSASNGGAVYIYSGREHFAFVNNCTFHNNSATGSGGTFFIKEASLNISNSVLLGNIAERGSALFCFGPLHFIVVMKSQFVRNRVYISIEKQRTRGTVVDIDNSADFIMKKSFFKENVGTSLSLRHTRGQIFNSFFTDSVAGGAIKTRGFSSLLLITNSCFIRSGDYWSDVLDLSNTNIVIQSCTFVAHNAPRISNTICVDRQKSVNLRLSGIFFTEPSLLFLDDDLNNIICWTAQESMPAIVYFWNNAIKYGTNKPLHLNRKTFVNISTPKYIPGVNRWTMLSSQFASGMCQNKILSESQRKGVKLNWR